MKAKKRRLPALSRRGKVIRNLLGFAAVLLGAWVLFGCPAWTENGALRQLERTLLLEPGTVRCREDGDRCAVRVELAPYHSGPVK